MRSSIFRCSACGRYTMSEKCPECGSPAYSAVPPKYSPKDRFQRFRLKEMMEDEHGKNNDNEA